MTDTAVLVAAIHDAGYDVKTLSRAMCMTQWALRLKINGRLQFNTTEMQELKNLLHLSNEMARTVFFSG